MSEPKWEVVQDRLEAFQSLIRLRSDKWELHSWNIFKVLKEGKSLPHPYEYKRSTYEVEYVASVWRRLHSEPAGEENK